MCALADALYEIPTAITADPYAAGTGGGSTFVAASSFGSSGDVVGAAECWLQVRKCWFVFSRFLKKGTLLHLLFFSFFFLFFFFHSNRRIPLTIISLSGDCRGA